MSQYHGGKQRIGKYIAKIIQNIYEKNEGKIKSYVEPFCGMLGVYEHIPAFVSPKVKLYAGDYNKSVIAMWKKAQKGWVPPTKVTREEFYEIKESKDVSALKGFVGHAASFRGVFLNSYFPDAEKVKRYSKNVVRIGEIVKKVKFKAGSYTNYSNMKNAIIYCDPPYAGGEQKYSEGVSFKNRMNFDSDAFWIWAKKMAKHNIVLVSEYSPPKKSLGVKVKKIFERKKERLYLVVPE